MLRTHHITVVVLLGLFHWSCGPSEQPCRGEADCVTAAPCANYAGQLGDGTGGNPDDVAMRTVAVDVKGLPADIVQLQADSDASSIVTQSGDIFSWGRNARGQLGDGTTQETSIPVPVIGP